jgi:flagellar hook-associated protein 1 FlgK
MSLFGTIQISSNALNAASLGLQVTGNNIANANTPGYIRERLVQVPATSARKGDLLLGLGVQVTGVQQVIDRFLESRVRGAGSDVARSEAQADVYGQLESAINELGDKDLSTSLTDFFGSLQNVLNQPESTAVRNVAVQKAQALSEAIRRLDGQVKSIHEAVDGQIANLASDINELLSDVAELNVQIVQMEGGGTSKSDATGLRDRRAQSLAKLAEITDIQTIEQPTGDISVYSNGDFLVSLGTARQVGVVSEVRNGLTTSHVEIAGVNAPLGSSGGRLGGLTAGRDEALVGFREGLDELAKSLVFEFNKIHSTGQGLTGYSQVTSERAIADTGVPLDSAGLPFAAVNGSFQIQVYNSQSNERTTTDIRVDLNGLDADTTLQSLATQIDAIDGVAASINSRGFLQISSESAEQTFAFAGDTSGALAALGINTFFTGENAQNIGVNQLLRNDASKLAVSSGGLGEDSENGARLASLLEQPLGRGGLSLAGRYEQLTSNVALSSQSASAAADGFRSFQQALEGQHLAISGVNIDEEAVRMIEYQRVYQASARVISTVNELLDTLLNL